MPVEEQPPPLRAGGLDCASDTEGESAQEAAPDELTMEDNSSIASEDTIDDGPLKMCWNLACG